MQEQDQQAEDIENLVQRVNDLESTMQNVLCICTELQEGQTKALDGYMRTLQNNLGLHEKHTVRLSQIVNSWQAQMSGANLERFASGWIIPWFRRYLGQELRRGKVEGKPLCTDR